MSDLWKTGLRWVRCDDGFEEVFAVCLFMMQRQFASSAYMRFWNIGARDASVVVTIVRY